MHNHIVCAQVFPPKSGIKQGITMTHENDRYCIRTKRVSLWGLFDPIHTFESFHSIGFALERFKALKAKYRKEFAQ